MYVLSQSLATFPLQPAKLTFYELLTIYGTIVKGVVSDSLQPYNS